MLRRLKVENYALIDRLELELDDRLNIITGETGAGKRGNGPPGDAGGAGRAARKGGPCAV